MTQPSVRTAGSIPAVSIKITQSTPPSSARFSRSLLSCLASSATTNREPESLMMYATSSEFVEGYTVVVAPPAHITARSAKIHSSRVAAAIATRSSGCKPRDRKPAAKSAIRSLLRAHVHDSQPLAVGERNASWAGVALTRSINNEPMDVAGVGSVSGATLVRPALGTIDSDMTTSQAAPDVPEFSYRSVVRR